MVVKAVNARTEDTSVLGDFFRLAKHSCWNSRCVGFSFVPRKCNVPAHLLAIFSHFLSESVYWIEDALDHVLSACRTNVSAV